MKAGSSYERIYRIVARIPRGRVATYGLIAELADMPRAARQVGYALAALRDNWLNLPWHRVINARGEVSARHEPGFEDLQRTLLEREGVRFNGQGRVALERVLWTPGAQTTKSSPARDAALGRNKKAPKKKAPSKKPLAKRKPKPRPKRTQRNAVA